MNEPRIYITINPEELQDTTIDIELSTHRRIESCPDALHNYYHHV